MLKALLSGSPGHWVIHHHGHQEVTEALQDQKTITNRIIIPTHDIPWQPEGPTPIYPGEHCTGARASVL